MQKLCRFFAKSRKNQNCYYPINSNSPIMILPLLTWLLFSIMGYTTEGSMYCYDCIRQIPIIQSENINMTVLSRPPCAALSSAAPTEYEPYRIICEDGCAIVHGYIDVFDTVMWYEFRGCYDPETQPLLKPEAYWFPPWWGAAVGLPTTTMPPVYPNKTEYICPQMSKADVYPKIRELLYTDSWERLDTTVEDVANMSFSYCYCVSEFCNFDPYFANEEVNFENDTFDYQEIVLIHDIEDPEGKHIEETVKKHKPSKILKLFRKSLAGGPVPMFCFLNMAAALYVLVVCLDFRFM